MPSGIKELVISTTSPATETTSQTILQRNLGVYNWVRIDAALLGATGGTLDVFLQRRVNGIYQDWIRFTQLADGASAISYTVSLSEQIAGITTVGTVTTAVIAANTALGGHPGDEVRLHLDAGSGTSAGAIQTITFTVFQRE